MTYTLKFILTKQRLNADNTNSFLLHYNICAFTSRISRCCMIKPVWFALFILFKKANLFRVMLRGKEKPSKSVSVKRKIIERFHCNPVLLSLDLLLVFFNMKEPWLLLAPFILWSLYLTIQTISYVYCELPEGNSMSYRQELQNQIHCCWMTSLWL